MPVNPRRERRFFEYVRQRENVKRVLVIRNGLMGDVVFITPLFEHLRRTFPNVRCDVIVSDTASAILRCHPAIDQIYSLSSEATLIDHIRLFSSMRKCKYDIALSLETNSHYTLMMLLTGARFRAGFSNSLDFLLDWTIPWGGDKHAVIENFRIIQPWTLSIDEHVIQMSLAVSDDERKEAEKFLRKRGIDSRHRFVCIHPGCSGVSSIKHWIPSRFGEVADELIKREGVQVVFTGVGKDVNEIETIRQAMKHSSTNLAGFTSTRTLMSIMTMAAVVIAPDTGVLHMAVALGTPVVMLMGYTEPNDTGPFDPSRQSQVVRVDLPCSPCALKNPKPSQWEVCKNLERVPCMEQISSVMVIGALRKVLHQSIKEVHPA